MLGAVRVDDLEAVLQAVDQHDRGLPAGEGGLDPVLDVLGRGDLRFQFPLDGVRELRGVRDEDGRGERVVLGLADQVGGDVHRVGRGVGEDRDLGRTGLGVDADLPGEVALGGGDPDVAGAGHHVGGQALLGPVREHRDGLRPARRVHLVDAQQRARGEDRRVRQAPELLLRRGRERDRLDARLLGRHDVHDDGGRVHRAAARGVQPHALHRNPLLGHGAAGDHLGGVLGAALVAVDDPGAPDRLLQGGADGRVQLLQRGLEGLRGYPDLRELDPVEPLRILDQRRRATMMDVLADGPHLLQGSFYVELGTGQQVAQGAALGEGVTAQVDTRDHLTILSDRLAPPFACITG